MAGFLKLITAPTIEPVTVDEVKLHTHISHDVEDSMLANWIKSARELAEGYHGRSYLTQTWELSFDRFPPVPVLLPQSPVQSVIWIKYYDTDNVERIFDPAYYLVDSDSAPGRVTLAFCKIWPVIMLRPINAVKIRYVAGYGPTPATVPENVRDAIMLYCAYRNESRAGEGGPVPEHFFDLLRPDRLKS